MNSLISDKVASNIYKPDIEAKDVVSILSKQILADGFEIILDLEKSNGVMLVDEVTGEEYFDFFTFFASSPLGLNHPYLNSDFVKCTLGKVAVNKPSNSDIYTTYMADFVDTFAEVAKPDYMKYLFFISGGALAVENGLKVAFDWKVRKNFLKGYKEEKGHQVIHFKEAFHGRSGYTMSLTNTDPTKVKLFPKFNWPRIDNPKIKFPLENNLEEIIKSEETAIQQIKQAIKDNPDDIALIIIEPIQGEGGDNFFRPEFFKQLRQIADENEILLMFDEVQTGFGLTGKFWASEYYVKPDIIAFGKKAQVCGIMVSDRIDDIDDHVFKVSSRINSTWGANLTDMVRAKFILDVIKKDNLVENARVVGEHLKNELTNIQNDNPKLISNVRSLGLMSSFDFPSAEIRDKFRNQCYKEKLIILGCGEKSVRFRPPLTITKDEINKGLDIIKKVLKFISSN
ncbi:MAG: L-lysine 6-transaminase [Ignavibacteriaceae bacterium]|jgi:L-lysine 6-transaminase|nr:L-lysine 6-transaminase [Ignavibacteriaceae bacterium]